VWGIVRSHCGGQAWSKVQNLISTDVKISAGATRLPPAALYHPPPVSRCLGSATQQVSGWSTQEHTWEHIVRWGWKCLASGECTWVHARKCAWECLESLLGSVHPIRLGVYLPVQLGASLRACLGVYMRMNMEQYFRASYSACTCKCLGSLLGSLQSSRQGVGHRIQLGVYVECT